VRTERYLKVVVRIESFRKQKRVVVEKMVRRASVVIPAIVPLSSSKRLVDVLALMERERKVLLCKGSTGSCRRDVSTQAS
jgi:hypothetical protein